MFRSRKKDEPQLQQGDLISGVPILLVDEETCFSHRPTKARYRLGELDKQSLEKVDAVVLAPYRGPALVLSQCCDLARLDASGRILVAPIAADTDERFSSALGAQAQAAMKRDQELYFDELAGVTDGEAFLKNEKQFKKVCRKQLEALWLGKSVGVFPVAQSESFPRGVCFFEGISGVPGGWHEYVAEKVEARLKDEWRMVLQESLRNWIGRYGFPGATEDRLRSARLDGG